MRARSAVAAIAVSLAVGPFCGAFAAGAEEPSAPSGSFGFEITIKPHKPDGAAYVCEATLSDLKTGEPVFQPRVFARAGDEARASGGFSAAEIPYKFLLVVRVSGATATYSMEVLRKDEKIFRSAGTVTVAKQP